MNDKLIKQTDSMLSIIRIECLLEELIFQQILNRHSDINTANEKFKSALTNVDNEMKRRLEILPDANN